MPCQIADTLTRDGAPVVGAVVRFEPTGPILLQGGRPTDTRARITETDGAGAFSGVLPRPSEMVPEQPWRISVPGGAIQGPVPDVAGPLTLHDLRLAGWE